MEYPSLKYRKTSSKSSYWAINIKKHLNMH